MTDKLYSNPPACSNTNTTPSSYCVRPPCAKQQILETNPNAHQQHHQFCNSSSTYPIMPPGPETGYTTNHQSSNNIIVDNYNNLLLSPQNYPGKTGQNLCMYMDFTGQWDNNNRMSTSCEDTMKIPDKIEMIEITSKDLSPASYCSNLDIFVGDFYKSFGKDFGSYSYNNTNSYHSAGQKITEFPSCAQQQMSNNNLAVSAATSNLVDKTVKYCSIQKSQEFDLANTTKNYNGPNNNYAGEQGLTYDQSNCGYKTHSSSDLSQCQQEYATSGVNMYLNYFESSSKPQHNQFYQFDGIPVDSNYPQMSNVDQQTECSNDGSDIIVEESDDDFNQFTDFVDNKRAQSTGEAHSRCLVCNISYTPLGTQFYFLTLSTPLTMSTQKPVFALLVDIVAGNSCDKLDKYLCSECLGLLNTIDHLQVRLENFKNELLGKFRQTNQHIVYQNNREGEDLSAVKHDNNNNNNSKRNVKNIVKIARYKCRYCKKVLSLKDYCTNHLKRHKFRGYLCEICGKVYAKKRLFDLHYKEHRVKYTRTRIDAFRCSNCPKAFRTRSNLKEHENYCLSLLPHACKFCDKKFPSRTKLKNHVKLKHDKKFCAICSICNIGFVKLSAYKSHKISHSTDKKFACDKCDKSYKTLSNLNFHMKVHSSTLPFICQICQKGFMRKEYLEAHVNNHKGVKNFTCSVCDKKFVSQKNLDSHLKYHDGSIKTKSCNVCGKTMTTGFEEHLRIHNDLREFECELCNDRFNTKGTLNKHKKRKHVSPA